jgi:hypothetical protein
MFTFLASAAQRDGAGGAESLVGVAGDAARKLIRPELLSTQADTIGTG